MSRRTPIGNRKMRNDSPSGPWSKAAATDQMIYLTGCVILAWPNIEHGIKYLASACLKANETPVPKRFAKGTFEERLDWCRDEMRKTFANHPALLADLEGVVEDADVLGRWRNAIVHGVQIGSIGSDGVQRIEFHTRTAVCAWSETGMAALVRNIEHIGGLLTWPMHIAQRQPSPDREFFAAFLKANPRPPPDA